MKYSVDRKKYHPSQVIFSFKYCITLETEDEIEKLVTNKRMINSDVYKWCTENYGVIYYADWAFHIKLRKPTKFIFRFRNQDQALAFKLAWS